MVENQAGTSNTTRNADTIYMIKKGAELTGLNDPICEHYPQTCISLRFRQTTLQY